MERLVDTHSHLAMNEFYPDLEETIERASLAGVERMLVVGSDGKAGADACRLVAEGAFPGFFAAVGIHPHDSGSVSGVIPAELAELAGYPGVAAVGETGLDYFYDHSPVEIQKKVFALHVALAKESARPLVVHIRDAYDDALDILRREGASECGGVIHCFSGDLHHALAAIELGFYISFAGPLTYPKNGPLRSIASAIPLDRILCETDSPYLSPQPRRGRRNEPANVRFVYEELAQARGITFKECADAVWNNASALFKWGDSEC